MAVDNRSSGPPGRDADDTHHELQAYVQQSSSHKEVFKALRELMNSSMRLLSSPAAPYTLLNPNDLVTVQSLCNLARKYKRHLRLPDAISVAMVTSEDIIDMQAVISAIPDSILMFAVLNKANELLDADDLRFSYAEHEVWLGKRDDAVSEFYLSARIVTLFE